VSVTISPNDNNAQGNGSTSFTRTYNNNTQVTLTAPSTAGGNNFAKWQRDGVDASTTVSTTVIMDANHTMTAVYVVPPPTPRTLTIASSNPGSGVSVTVSPNDNNAQGNGSTSFTRTYNNNTQVTLTASSTAGGNNFAKWQRDGVDASTTVSTTVIMDANHTMTAVYVAPSPPPQPATSAIFVGKNTATQGNWAGVYSVDGHNIINHSVNYPGYATVIANGITDYTWASSTSDVRALRKKGATTDRIAACWHSASNFTIDLNLTDGLSHRIALYCLDWDTTVRAEQIDILDASDNSVLSSQSVTGFNGGQYLIWEIKGHVLIRVTNTGSFNAVISGIFFDPSGEPPPQPTTRTLTVASSNPSAGVSVNVAPNDNNNQGNGTTSSSFTRTYYDNTPVTLTAPSTAGGNNFQKWQRDGFDWSTSLSTSVTMDANHTMTVVYVAPSPPPQPATSAIFVGKNTATQGNWAGVYSVDGHNIINHSVNYPGYATVIANGVTDYTWASSTSDVRALRKKGATTDRIAACWYSIGSITVDLNLTDGLSHRVALYCLDWDTAVRAEQIDILNASDNSVLSSQSVTGFNGGQYLIWEIKGHVLIRLTNTGPGNAVLSGIFFDPSGEPPTQPPPRTLTVASSNPGSGLSVTISPNDNNAQGNGGTSFTRTYNNNTQVTLTAPSTASGNNFQKWPWLRDGHCEWNH